MQLHLIFARAANGVIGKDGTMPWHLPEDLAHFKKTTLGCPVIMGRKTWDSLPPKFRPLPGRRNVVITRQADWQADGVTVAHSLQEAIDLCSAAPDVWVIGGAEIYRQALPLAVSAVVTEIETEYDGDAFAPQFTPDWLEETRVRHLSSSDLGYSFVTYLNTRGV
jgi:dihydrofolate reductase